MYSSTLLQSLNYNRWLQIRNYVPEIGIDLHHGR